MSTEPTPDTRAIYRVLQQVLEEPRPPALADLAITHRFLIEDPGDGAMAFHYWAAGVNPSTPGADGQLAHFLLTLPESSRNAHVYRVCRKLAGYVDSAEPGDSPHREVEAHIVYLLWAAIVRPGESIQPVWDLVMEAGRVHPALASTQPLFQHALRRLAAPLSTEVQA